MTGTRAARLGLAFGVALAAVGLTVPATAQAATIPATLVKTTNTSAWAHPSSDPSGITYNSRTGELIIADGEVEETDIGPKNVWRGTNLFYTSLGGAQLATNRNTMAYSPEPTGVGFRPGNLNPNFPERLFITDDDQARLFEVTAVDGIYGNSNDTWTSSDIRFLNLGPRNDAEDVAVDLDLTRDGRLLLVDGKGKRVFVFNPGPDRVFNGTGDFVERTINVGNMGAGDPEGIAFNAARNTIFVLDDPSNRLYEVSLTGTLLNTVTLPFKMKSGAGLAFAPPSNGSSGMNGYIVDRGVDNNTNPDTFNDGRMYEVSIPGLGDGTPPSNTAPTVSAGPDQTITLPTDQVSLDGTVTDDGQPAGGSLTQTWSKVSGPGTVTFGNASAVDTTATFSAAGTYTLQLSASDGSLSASDTMTVTVNDGSTPPPGNSLDSPVRAGADDAEENTSTGAVVLGSSDLNLTQDGTVTMTVGVRFRGVALPAGATITNAWVQFQADESQSVATNLTIRAQNTANAPVFTTATRNVSSRALTTQSVSWSPAAWSTGQRTTAQRTPNLASVLQPVVSNAGWASGNAIALVITGTGERTAESYNAGAALAPVLHIEYTT